MGGFGGAQAVDDVDGGGKEDRVSAQAAVGGPDAAAHADVVTVQGQRLEGGFFLFEEVAGTPCGFAMGADVGDLFHPGADFDVEGTEAADFPAGEEVSLDVFDGVFDAAFFVAAADVAGDGFEAVVGSEVEVSGVEDRGVTGQALDDGGFQIVMLMCPTALCALGTSRGH
jgi:hypothetical protein